MSKQYQKYSKGWLTCIGGDIQNQVTLKILESSVVSEEVDENYNVEENEECEESDQYSENSQNSEASNLQNSSKVVDSLNGYPIKLKAWTEIVTNYAMTEHKTIKCYNSQCQGGIFKYVGGHLELNSLNNLECSTSLVFGKDILSHAMLVPICYTCNNSKTDITLYKNTVVVILNTKREEYRDKFSDFENWGTTKNIKTWDKTVLKFGEFKNILLRCIKEVSSSDLKAISELYLLLKSGYNLRNSEVDVQKMRNNLTPGYVSRSKSYKFKLNEELKDRFTEMLGVEKCFYFSFTKKSDKFDKFDKTILQIPGNLAFGIKTIGKLKEALNDEKKSDCFEIGKCDNGICGAYLQWIYFRDVLNYSHFCVVSQSTAGLKTIQRRYEELKPIKDNIRNDKTLEERWLENMSGSPAIGIFKSFVVFVVWNQPEIDRREIALNSTVPVSFVGLPKMAQSSNYHERRPLELISTTVTQRIQKQEPAVNLNTVDSHGTSENKTQLQEIIVHKKKDGTLDMRFKENRKK